MRISVRAAGEAAGARTFQVTMRAFGGVAEWLNAPVLKTGEGVTLP